MNCFNDVDRSRTYISVYSTGRLKNGYAFSGLTQSLDLQMVSGIYIC